MFPDKEQCLIYAHLCNSAFCLYYDLNDLEHCKQYLDTCISIRKNFLPDDHAEMAAVYANMATLLTTQGEHDAALGYWEISDAARKENGTEHLLADAVFQSSYGWACRLKGDYDQAKERYKRAQSVYASNENVENLVA
jgi:tetratricopeptide (TPR) repeat protein